MIAPLVKEHRPPVQSWEQADARLQSDRSRKGNSPSLHRNFVVVNERVKMSCSLVKLSPAAPCSIFFRGHFVWLSTRKDSPSLGETFPSLVVSNSNFRGVICLPFRRSDTREMFHGRIVFNWQREFPSRFFQTQIATVLLDRRITFLSLPQPMGK